MLLLNDPSVDGCEIIVDRSYYMHLEIGKNYDCDFCCVCV